MMETRIYKEKPPVVYDLDEYRHGLTSRANDAEVTTTAHQKIDLWTILSGQTMPLHVHTRSECTTIVLAGHGEYRLDDASYDLSEGVLVSAPPGARHGIRNDSPAPLVVLTVQAPGPFDERVLERGSTGQFY